MEQPLEAAPVAVDAPVPPESSEAPAAPVVARWQVAATKRVSLFGQLTTLSRGSIVSVAEYGPQAIERLREQGVVLEPMV